MAQAWLGLSVPPLLAERAPGGFSAASHSALQAPEEKRCGVQLGTQPGAGGLGLQDGLPQAHLLCDAE